MSVELVDRKRGRGWRARWWEGGRQRSQVFDRKRDAEAFEGEMRRRYRLGEMSFDAGAETLGQYVEDIWAHVHAAHLAPKTRKTYAWAYDLHIAPRLGDLALRSINPGDGRALPGRTPRRRRRAGGRAQDRHPARRHPPACRRGAPHPLQPRARGAQGAAPGARGGPPARAGDGRG